MSLYKKMQKLESIYLYPRMLYIINEDPKYLNDIKKYDKSSEKNLFENIMAALKNFNDNNAIANTIDYNEIYKYFDIIINFFKKNQRQKRMNQIIMLKNLLFTIKDNEVLPNFDDSKNENSFTINDLIYNYTLKALEKDLFNKDLTIQDSDDLFDLYLYMIFQIKEPNFIIKLKILIYNFFYEKKRDISAFLIESSKNIYELKNNDKETLKNLQKKFNEIDNINFKNVSDNIVSFFNGESNKIKDLIKIFNITKIQENFNKIKLGNIRRDDIAIDDLNFDPKKFNFFSPEFLIVNGLKSEFEKCDFEMFNSDNYGVDIFSKFLDNNIIPEINKSMNQNNFSTEFIQNKLIKFHKDDLRHFLSAKLDYNTKEELNKLIYSNFKNTDFLKINVIGQKKFENEIINKQDNTKNDRPKENGDKSSKSSNLSSSKLSNKEFKKKSADDFEELVYQKLIKNIEKNNLISLPNILFMLNLKVPEYDVKTNTIKFKSIHLDFSKKEENLKNEIYYYGWKEIDAIFYNNSEKFIGIEESAYFSTNLTYVKEKSELESFPSFQEVNDDKFIIYPKSIIFCEVKNSFPNIGEGTEKVYRVSVEENQLKKIDKSKTYDNQLPKLIKKFKYFFKVFQDNIKEKEELKNIHLIYLYDTFNVKNDKPDSNFESIKKLTEEKLKNYGDQIDISCKVVFQLVFFDLFLFNQHARKKNEEKDKIIESQKNKIESQKNKIESQKLFMQLIYSKHDSIKAIVDNKKLEKGEKHQKIFDLFQGQIPLDDIQFLFSQ